MYEARVEDRWEIQDLIHRWCRVVDRRDWDRIPDLFHEDARDDHGVFKGGVEAMTAWLKTRHAHIVHSMHHSGNILIDFAGADRAVVETYIVVAQRYGEEAGDARLAMLGPEAAGIAGDVDMGSVGRYVDTVERRGGPWKIAKRVVIYERILTAPSPAYPQMDPAWAVGRRDRQDPLFPALREAGIV